MWDYSLLFKDKNAKVKSQTLPFSLFNKLVNCIEAGSRKAQWVEALLQLNKHTAEN